MADDDSISPTLPTFDLRPRVSRDQTGIRAASSSQSRSQACSSSSSSRAGGSSSACSSDSMPIILQMTPGETIVVPDQSLGSSSKDLRRPASRYRPASLAATLRPRRASTGGGLADWISFGDPQTPTNIVDLERMASGFPSIPRGVDEEEEEDAQSGETGCKRLEHDRLDSITSWQRNCCEFPPRVGSLLFDLREEPCRPPHACLVLPAHDALFGDRPINDHHET